MSIPNPPTTSFNPYADQGSPEKALAPPRKIAVWRTRVQAGAHAVGRRWIWGLSLLMLFQGWSYGNLAHGIVPNTLPPQTGLFLAGVLGILALSPVGRMLLETLARGLWTWAQASILLMGLTWAAMLVLHQPAENGHIMARGCIMLGALGTMLIMFRRHGPRRQSRIQICRHEAGHALVACVLGRHVEEAFVRLWPAFSQVQGSVTHWSTHGTLSRRDPLYSAAISIAGILAERRDNCMESVYARLSEQISDYWMCKGVAPLAGVRVEAIISSLMQDMYTPAWNTAIHAAARILETSPTAVPGAVFAQIIQEHALDLPKTRSLGRSSDLHDQDHAH